MTEKEKTGLLINIATPDDSNSNTKETEKTKQVQRPADRGQQDVQSEDKNCANCTRSIGNNSEEIRSERSVSPGSYVGHRVIDHTL